MRVAEMIRPGLWLGCQEAEAFSILEAEDEAFTLFKLEAEALVMKPKPKLGYLLHVFLQSKTLVANRSFGKPQSRSRSL